MSASDRSSVEIDCDLEPRFAQLRALRAAWEMLAPSVGLSEPGLAISESGRSLTDQCNRLGQLQGEPPRHELTEFDRELNEFEQSMRAVAAELSISQLRATLPSYLISHRTALLDLLDVLIGKNSIDLEGATDRIGAIDYLVTLLCIANESLDGTVRHDPVSLTPRVQALCERAEEECGNLFADVEAEFFAASNMDSEDLREEFQLRTLRSRKAELGMVFFVPRILRAVITYNAALLDRVASEVLDSSDWGFSELARNSEAVGPARAESVFQSKPLRQIAEAVRQRATDAETLPEAGNSAAQIAWALDFEYLEASERKALLGEALGTKEDMLGTAILIGLICRSLAVLSVELQAVGISPDDVSDQWMAELAEVFQEQINQSIEEDAYKIACALSELKNKFLSDPLADQYRQQRESKPHPPISAPPRQEGGKKAPAKEPSARDLVKEALEQGHGDRPSKSRATSWNQLPWMRFAQAVALIAVLVTIGNGVMNSSSDLERFTNAELEAISPHLIRGGRTQSGLGPAFIGRIDEEWLLLTATDRDDAANRIVLHLRELGLSQIMIYDSDDALRIQAVGSQPIRTL